MTAPGALSQEVKSLLAKNDRELASIEGNILSMTGSGRDLKTLLVTSCHPREGKTLSAISIAYGLFQETNLKVLLVDGNLRAPRLNALFSVAEEPGFADFVMKDADNVFRETEFENFMVMPHGSATANPLDIYRSPLFGGKVEMLRSMFDYVVFDGGPILGTSDMSVAARHFDGVLVVLECERTKWEILEMAVTKIRKLRGNVIGTVMNRRKYYIPRYLYGKI
ncbi:MAG: CpsD/CapB family tyrosine-protein kinase [Nitrospirales bacterium]|nr:CpsD/CapB family tyrosine-protein kinase [Nitrospirales bacterium]